RRSCSWLFPGDAVDLTRPAEALQLDLAPAVEPELLRVLGELAEESRDDDLTTLRLRRDACRLVDRAAEEGVGVPNGLTDVEPDSHPQRRLEMGHAVVGKGTLDRDGTAQRAPGAPEYEHEAVAEALDLESVVGPHLLPHQPVVDGEQFLGAVVSQAV